MTNRTFIQWCLKEGKDIFGFDKEVAYERKRDTEDDPVKNFNIESLTTYLKMHKLGAKHPKVVFINEVRWGEGNPGDIRVRLGTGLSVYIDRRGNDLLGNSCWFTRKAFQINREGYGGYENIVAHELMEYVRKIDTSPLEYAKKQYEELDRLVSSMVSSLKRTARNYFIFEGVRKLNDKNFIIRFSVRGHGVEAPDQRRVLENQTHIVFNEETGILRLFNFNIETDTGKAAKWELMPNDTDFYFAPSQSRDEIIETIADTLHWY